MNPPEPFQIWTVHIVCLGRLRKYFDDKALFERWIFIRFQHITLFDEICSKLFDEICSKLSDN